MICPLCDKDAGQSIVGHLAIVHGMKPVQMLATLFWQVDILRRDFEEHITKEREESNVHTG